MPTTQSKPVEALERLDSSEVDASRCSFCRRGIDHTRDKHIRMVQQSREIRRRILPKDGESLCHHQGSTPILDNLCPLCFERTTLDRLERLRSQLLKELDATKLALTQATAKLNRVRLTKPGYHCTFRDCTYTTANVADFVEHKEGAHKPARSAASPRVRVPAAPREPRRISPSTSATDAPSEDSHRGAAS